MCSLRLTLKIAIPLGIMVALILLMAADALVTLTVDKDVTADIRNTINKQRGLADVESAYVRLLMAENSYALSGDRHYLADYKVKKADLHQSLNDLRVFPLTPNEQNELDTFQAELTDLERQLADVFGEDYTDAKQDIQASVVQMDNSFAIQLEDEIANLSNSVENEVEGSLLRMEAADRREFWFTVIPILLVVPIAVAVVFITIYRISKPLLRLVQMAEKITMRDFSTRMHERSMDEIGMLTKAFNAMAEEIERRYNELESFAYIVAHDLKNPVSGIQGLSGYVLENAGDRIHGDEREAIETIENAAKSMNLLITDLLEFAKAGKIEFSTEPISMDAMLQNIIKELNCYIKERKAKISIQGDLPSLYCDPIRLSQVWKNLIYNALKYNDNEEPTVSISVQDTNDGLHLFQVKDNGIGIDEKDYESIFLPFQRGDTEGEYEGTGIGLAIVKRVVDYHGGTIWVTSQKGQGTTFSFTLPRLLDGEDVLSHDMMLA